MQKMVNQWQPSATSRKDVKLNYSRTARQRKKLNELDGLHVKSEMVS